MARKKSIELTPEDFKDISTSVAARLCVEAQEHNVSGIKVAIITAIFCSELDTALFDDEKLEVEE